MSCKILFLNIFKVCYAFSFDKENLSSGKTSTNVFTTLSNREDGAPCENSWKPFTSLAKCFISDVWQGSNTCLWYVIMSTVTNLLFF